MAGYHCSHGFRSHQDRFDQPLLRRHELLRYIRNKFLAGAAGTLTLTAPKTRQVSQRNGSSEATITISGSVNTTCDDIQARLIPRPGFTGVDTGWVSIDNSDAFSGTLTAEAGWYDLFVRGYNGGELQASNSVQRVGIGEVFIVAGQSNAANYGASVQTPANDNFSSRSLVGTWALGTDPQPSAGNTMGSPWPAFGDALITAIDVPVAVISVAVGSTRVSDWLPGTSNYDDKLAAAIALFPTNGFRAVLWHQGESDSTTVTTQAAYQTDLRTIITESRTDAGWTVPWGIAVTATYNGTETMQSVAQVQAAQTAVAADANNFAGANTDDITSGTYRSDDVHMTVAGLTLHGQRWAEAVADHFGW